MKPEDLEQKLSSQPLRSVPPEWRAEILSAASAAQPAHFASPVARRSFLSTINYHLSTLLWPNQKAWAGLAAVWVVILALNHSTQDGAPAGLAKNSEPPSPEMVVELKKQQKLYAELTGINEPKEADRPRETLNRPRTWRVEVVAV